LFTVTVVLCSMLRFMIFKLKESCLVHFSCWTVSVTKIVQQVSI
jgi:hypothetical protein